MSAMSDLIRGHTDTVILAQLMKQDSYGYAVNKAIKNSTGGMYELNEATLYTAFKRLEDAGCITSYWGDEPGHARRKYYHITVYGRDIYRMLAEEWQRTRDMIDHLLILEE